MQGVVAAAEALAAQAMGRNKTAEAQEVRRQVAASLLLPSWMGERQQGPTPLQTSPLQQSRRVPMLDVRQAPFQPVLLAVPPILKRCYSTALPPMHERQDCLATLLERVQRCFRGNSSSARERRDHRPAHQLSSRRC
jgi:hypothetical protein